MSTDAELISWLRRTPLYDSTGDSIDDRADEAADRLAALIAERDRLKEALEPFESFAANVDENGWTSSIHRERISTWFGPSDFRRARAALSPTQEMGE